MKKIIILGLMFIVLSLSVSAIETSFEVSFSETTAALRSGDWSLQGLFPEAPITSIPLSFNGQSVNVIPELETQLDEFTKVECTSVHITELSNGETTITDFDTECIVSFDSSFLKVTFPESENEEFVVLKESFQATVEITNSYREMMGRLNIQRSSQFLNLFHTTTSENLPVAFETPSMIRKITSEADFIEGNIIKITPLIDFKQNSVTVAGATAIDTENIFRATPGGVAPVKKGQQEQTIIVETEGQNPIQQLIINFFQILRNLFGIP